MTHQGHYLGTEIDEQWWRRYRQGALFARGNGTYRIDQQGLHFKRYFLAPFTIPLAQVQAVKLGKWHSGRWVGGRPVLKLCWEHQGQRLCSGFVLTRRWQEAEDLRQHITALMRQAQETSADD